MCIILVENTSRPAVHKDWFADFVSRNRDGSGIMVSAGDRVYTEKLLSNDPDKTYEMYLRGREAGAWLAFHARHRTHGVVDTDNLHPYIVNENLYMMHNGVLSTGYGVSKDDHPAIKQRMAELAAAPKQIAGVSIQSGYTGLAGNDYDYEDIAFSRSKYSGVATSVTKYTPPAMTEADKAAATFSDTWHYIEDWIKPLLNGMPNAVEVQQFRDLVGAHIGGNNRFVFATPTGMYIINARTGVFPSDRWLSNTYAWSGTAATDLLAPKPAYTTYSPTSYKGVGTGYEGKKSAPQMAAVVGKNPKRTILAIEKSAAYALNRHHDVGGDYWDTVYAGWNDKYHNIYTAPNTSIIHTTLPVVITDEVLQVPTQLTTYMDHEKALQVLGFNKAGKFIKARRSIAEGAWEPYIVPYRYAKRTTPTVSRLFDNANNMNSHDSAGIKFSRATGNYSALASALYRCTTSGHDEMLNLETWDNAERVLKQAFTRCPLYASFCDLPNHVITSMLVAYVAQAQSPAAQVSAGVAYRLAAAAYHGFHDGSRLSPIWFLSLLEFVYDLACKMAPDDDTPEEEITVGDESPHPSQTPLLSNAYAPSAYGV